MKYNPNLEQKLEYHYKAFDKTKIEPDPLQFPHLFQEEKDIEVMAFIASVFAYGNVKQIINSLNKFFPEHTYLVLPPLADEIYFVSPNLSCTGIPNKLAIQSGNANVSPEFFLTATIPIFSTILCASPRQYGISISSNNAKDFSRYCFGNFS